MFMGNNILSYAWRRDSQIKRLKKKTEVPVPHFCLRYQHFVCVSNKVEKKITFQGQLRLLSGLGTARSAHAGSCHDITAL